VRRAGSESLVDLQHLASFDYALPLRRLMERPTVEGSVPY